MFCLVSDIISKAFVKKFKTGIYYLNMGGKVMSHSRLCFFMVCIDNMITFKVINNTTSVQT